MNLHEENMKDWKRMDEGEEIVSVEKFHLMNEWMIIINDIFSGTSEISHTRY